MEECCGRDQDRVGQHTKTGAVQWTRATTLTSPDERAPERILVVDDNPAVLSLAKIVLYRKGYDVLAAVSPEEALEICRQQPSSIDLLISDVVMPGMTGPELANAVLSLGCVADRKERPHVLFMSGYSDLRFETFGSFQNQFRMLHKPFTPAQLLAAVTEALAIPEEE